MATCEKCQAKAENRRDHINRAIQKFLKYPCPPFVKRWVLVWEKGDREPEIIDVAEVKDEDHSSIPTPN